ncbi:MAG: aminotransferase class III-fold pyridoxal phosphate-dependent enzyme [Paracoccaceae bacterium]
MKKNKLKKITHNLSYWEKLLPKFWKIGGNYEKLNSEFDLNIEVSDHKDSKFIIKIMRNSCEKVFLEGQIDFLKFIDKSDTFFPVSKIYKSFKGNDFEILKDENGNERYVWIVRKIEGELFSDFKPKSNDLMLDLGKKVGNLDLFSKRYTKNLRIQDNKWNLTKPFWIENHFSEIKDLKIKNILIEILNDFKGITSVLQKLKSYWIHNDLNDQNLLVANNLGNLPEISGILDFGDLSFCPTICNIAICSSYLLILPDVGLDKQLHFLKGYHNINPISVSELDILYTLIMVRIAVSYVNSVVMSKKKPKDPYVIISQKDTKNFLLQIKENKDFITSRFRHVCGFSLSSSYEDVQMHLTSKSNSFFPAIKGDLNASNLINLDPQNCAIPQDPYDIKDSEALNLTGFAYKKNNDKIYLGKYLEPRLIYTSENFFESIDKNSNRRTIHLGIDVFCKKNTKVFCPDHGEVVLVDNCQERLDYGGFIVLKHFTSKGSCFFSLFGHLDPKSINLKIGQKVKKGKKIGKIGNNKINGGWEPHLHIQLSLGLGQGKNWPGVCNPSELKFWEKYCPNPAPFLGINPQKIKFKGIEKKSLIQNRKNHYSGNLKISYKEPLMLTRGYKNYMFDENGNCFLDFYNNVPHVGHSHPRIAALVYKQLKLINSNTRYLHPIQKEISENILSRFSKKFSAVYLVNSGSEANELALRLAKTYTKSEDFITFDHGYHGNTNGVLEVSPYKFNKPNGIGKKQWVHVIDCPDPFRAVNPKYQIDEILKKLKSKKRGLAGFISEIFPSVAGQIIPQDGIMSYIYEKVKKAGGICIADEVQTGLGRLGDFYFGFEQQKVDPDIVVLGKPIGNGHPIGVVITTEEIAKSFDNGIEFFSTFGGSDLSCLIANEVLKIVDDENLKSNAKKMGDILIKELNKLKFKFPIIGDVRGMGLFLGVEIVNNFETKEPGTQEADYICNRLREKNILIGLEGPSENVIKIRPPLCLNKEDVFSFIRVFSEVLSDTSLNN